MHSPAGAVHFCVVGAWAASAELAPICGSAGLFLPQFGAISALLGAGSAWCLVRICGDGPPLRTRGGFPSVAQAHFRTSGAFARANARGGLARIRGVGPDLRIPEDFLSLVRGHFRSSGAGPADPGRGLRGVGPQLRGWPASADTGGLSFRSSGPFPHFGGGLCAVTRICGDGPDLRIHS